MTADQPWVPAEEFDGELDHDFDEAWATKRPKHIKVLGRVYRLPPERPAKVMILLLRERRMRDTTGERNLQLLEEVLETMLTPAGYQQLLDDGIGLDTQLPELVEWIMKAYDQPGRQAGGEGDAEGEATAPATGAG